MFAEANGTKLFFDVAGLQYEADGPIVKEKPVCLVFHGGPGSSHMHYLPAILPLAKTMQLIFIDDRNCGKSERGDITASTLKQNAADGEAIRKYLGLGKVFVLGQSYGGMTTQRYTIDYPDNLYGSIVICSAPSYRMSQGIEDVIKRRGTKEQLQAYRDILSGKGDWKLESFLDFMGNLYHYNFTDQHRQENHDSCKRSIGWASNEVNHYQMTGELKEFDMVPELKNVKTPMLILGGKEDFITPIQNSIEIHEAVPGSELIIAEESAHEIMDDRPDLFFPAVEAFVEKHFIK